MTRPTVTLVTTVMDRLDHLKTTFVKNVEDNANAGIDFLLLNYGSEDEMDQWVRDELILLAGCVMYARVLNPSGRWCANHAKNVGTLLAKGDVVVNVDADNRTGPGFADVVADLLPKPSIAFAWPGPSVGHKDCAGRLAMWRSDFVALGGYDEEMTDWGFTDADLRFRAKAFGLAEEQYPQAVVGSAISHGADLRTRHTEQRDVSVSFRLNQARSQAQIKANRIIANDGFIAVDTIVQINWDKVVTL